MAETFGEYLAKNLVANKGYQFGHPPEAAALAADCDFLLIHMDGYSVIFTAIIDGERNPGRVCTLTREQLLDIAAACQRYCGNIRGTTMPVTIHLIETGLMPITAEQKQRLSSYRKRIGSVAHIHSHAVDVNQREVYSPGRFGGISNWGRYYRNLLRAPRRQFTAESFQPPVTNLEQKPVATYALMALILVFYAAYSLAYGRPVSGPTVPELLDIGGLNFALVQGGEWWRLVTMMFLHGGLLHIGMNTLVLYMAGNALERMVGWAWFVVIFVASGILGSAFSLAFNTPDITAVGASGAIMGVVAAAYACSYRLPSGPMRTSMQMNMAQVLVLSTLPVLFASGSGIDFYSHIGGAVMGGLLGWLAYTSWPRQQALPGLQPLMRSLSGLCILLCLYGGWQVQQHLQNGPHYAVALASLEELEAMPRSAEGFRNSGLLEKYPDDPRVQLMEGLTLLDEGDVSAPKAEEKFRQILDGNMALRYGFTPAFRTDIEAVLAISLFMQGRMQEARDAAKQACREPEGTYLDMLREASLCD